MYAAIFYKLDGQIYTGCPKKNAAVIFSVTTGTTVLRTRKTNTDM